VSDEAVASRRDAAVERAAVPPPEVE